MSRIPFYARLKFIQKFYFVRFEDEILKKVQSESEKEIIKNSYHLSEDSNYYLLNSNVTEKGKEKILNILMETFPERWLFTHSLATGEEIDRKDLERLMKVKPDEEDTKS